jgi:hypothetical protein
LYYYRSTRRTFGRSQKVAGQRFTVKPGEALDVGDLRLKSVPKEDGE